MILFYHLGDEWNDSLADMNVNKLNIKNQWVLIIFL